MTDEKLLPFEREFHDKPTRIATLLDGLADAHGRGHEHGDSTCGDDS